MDMPPIHMCAFLNHENERLKTKIINLKQRINDLEKRITERNLDHIHSCSISCQTDIDIKHPHSSNSSAEINRLHRLLKAQNDILRKYEHENENQYERKDFSSSELIKNYERRLIHCQKEKEQAEQRAILAEQRMKKYEERYERMKKEISSLDGNFFNEIEDIKYALQQAKNLNREYEKTVQMLSNRLGIPYPKIADKIK